MPSNYTTQFITEMTDQLQVQLDEKKRKVKLYQEHIDKGMIGFYDLLFLTKDEIEFIEKQIDLMKHPEKNPQLYIRFDVQPKVLKVTIS